MNYNRNKIIKWTAAIGCFLLGILIGCLGLILWYCSTTTVIKEQNEYDSWQLAYYLFSIIGSIGTLFAVIVALAKESIMKLLYKPDLRITLIDDGITEVINERQRVPEADCYECYIQVENKGSIAALGCKAYICEVKHGKQKSNAREIKKITKKQLRWTSYAVDLPVSIPSRIRLFEIKNPNRIGTPQLDKEVQKPRIEFNGCELSTTYLEKGCWEINYYITCTNGDVLKFVSKIEWNGEFRSRATDMKEVLNINIE